MCSSGFVFMALRKKPNFLVRDQLKSKFFISNQSNAKYMDVSAMILLYLADYSLNNFIVLHSVPLLDIFYNGKF